jgi:uncharacterized membrane protein
MDNNSPWLRAEIAQWLREGVITDEQAKLLYARYPATLIRGNTRTAGGGRAIGHSAPWGKVIFAVLGVLVFGLGVLLFFAYNWDGMHRYLKLMVIGGGVLLSHTVGLFLLRPGSSQPRLGESMHLLGTVLFGAGIWLVAQIYHFDAHYPDGFLIWWLAALSLAWALPSVAQAMLATVLLVLWSGLETFEFSRQLPVASWVLLLAVLPLAWWQRSRSLLSLLLLLIPLLYGFTIWQIGEQLLLPVSLLFAVGYFALAKLAPLLNYPESASVFNVCATSICLPLIFIGSFTGIPEYSGWALQTLGDMVYLLMPLLFAVSSWLAVLLISRARPMAAEWLEAGLILSVLWLVLVPTLMGVDLVGWGRMLCNIVFLLSGLLFVYRGTEFLQGKILALGCLMIVALALARFSDLFQSLLMRSVVFLLLGIVLFVIGQRYSQQSTRQKLEKPRA